MEDCLFCKIAAGEIDTEFIYEDDNVVVFKDIHPKAPIHVLIVPKKHIKSLNELSKDTSGLAGVLLAVVGKISKRLGVDNGGYKTVINTGSHGGQVIEHLHIHILGGEKIGGFAV